MRAARTIGALVACLTAVQAAAQDAAGPTPAQVAAWADQLLPRRVNAGDAPGVVAAIVYRGEVVYLKGYGYADDGHRVAMDPSRTMVRVGGVAQVATAAAMLAAAETGVIRLMQDMHGLWERAQFKIESPSTVTLQELLTHTAGFRDRLLGQFAPSEVEWEPLQTYLARVMPPVVIRSGDAVLPSEHGIALAGLTLQFAAGKPFQDVAQQLVFAPLAMTSSTFEPKLGRQMLEQMAQGHRWAGTVLEPVPYDYPRAYPAVGLVTTAADMAKLLQVVLGGGALGGTRLWSEESNRNLITRRATNHPSMAGRSFAFVETPVGGRTLWINDGLANGFGASMTLVPDLGLGVFVAANAGVFQGIESLSPAGALVRQFSTDLVGALWPPVAAPAVAARNIAPDDRVDYAGVYRDAGIDIDTPLKLLRLRESLNVDELSDVRIVVAGQVYQKVGLDLFQNGPNFIRFLRDGEGNVTHLLRANDVEERSPAFESDIMQRAFFFFALTLLALGALVSLLGLLLGWRGKLANLIGLVAAGGGLALIGWIAWQVTHFSMGVAVVYGIAGLPFATPLWLIPAAAAFIGFFYALFGIGIKNANRFTLIGTALAWAALYPLLNTWNLIA